MKGKKPQTAISIQQLTAMRGKRGRVWAARKKALLRKIAQLPLDAAGTVRAYHDLLLYLLAFADDAESYRLARSGLKRIAANIKQARSSGHRLVRNLQDSGIAHTDLQYAYTLPVARWLTQTFADDVDLAWDDEAVETTLEELGQAFFPHVEQSAMLTNRMTTRALFEIGSGDDRTVLSWLIDRYDAMMPTARPNMEFFDLMDLPLRWQLDAKLASRTFNRFPARRISYAGSGAKKNLDLRQQLAVTLPRPEKLSLKDSQRLIDIARATLSVRQRETEAVTYPNPYEVDLFKLKGGIDVAIFGMAPQHRLSVDSFFGFVAAKNGVPVAYGGGFVYLQRLDIGLNIFREFRGGQSAYLFSQILHAFCQHYNSTQIVIDSAQFGYGRPGGIQSGAFWFYYRLGFRPVDSELTRLAEQEWVRIKAQKGYRTSAATLRRFTTSNLLLQLDASGSRTRPVADMADISLAVTQDAATHYNGDRTAQASSARRRVMRWLKVGDTRSWPAAERQSFLRLCPLIALIPDLPDWSDPQKRSLVALMRAKGGRQERRYVVLSQRHRRLATALAGIAGAR